MVNKKLVKFIKQARKRGCSDKTIKDALVNHGWPIIEVENAFVSLVNRYKSKNQVILYLDTEVLEKIDKRAKKNLLTIPEQIEDILRRSTINQKNKKSGSEEKLDDNLIALFSRKNTGPKKGK